MDVESGETRLLAASRAAEFQPLFSPDGRWIAISVSDDPPRWAFYLEWFEKYLGEGKG